MRSDWVEARTIFAVCIGLLVLALVLAAASRAGGW